MEYPYRSGYRSTLDNVFNFISALPQGHDKPVKHALYNALALFALFLCCAASYALYVILGPFIKPLIWALLVGSVLHPFKCSLAKRFRSWFDALEESRTPIFIGIFIVPVNIINDLSEIIGSKLLKYSKYIVAVAIAIPLLHVIYYYTPRLFICLTWKLASYTHALISFIIKNATATSILLILIGYISLMIVLWSPKNNKKFHYASICIWLLLSCFLAHQFGAAFQTPIFIAVQIIFLAGFAYEVYDIHEEMVAEGHHISLVESLIWAFHDKYLELKDGDQDIEIIEKEVETSLDSAQDSQGGESLDDKSDTPTRTKSTVKFDMQNTANAPPSLPTTPTDKDPWSLELFEQAGSSVKLTEQPSVTFQQSSEDQLQNIENVGSLPTIRNKMQITKQPSDPSPQISEIFHRNRHRDPSLLKFRRSHSQPQVSSLRSRSSLFNFRKRSDFERLSSTSHKIIHPTQYASDFYLYTLMWGCAIMTFWKNLMLLPIFVIPILIYIIKHVGIYLRLWSWLFAYWIITLDFVNNWCADRYDALIPVPIRGIYKVMHKANANLKKGIKESIDTVSSCLVILGLLIFVVCASVFVAIQIYTEAIMLVQMTSNVINQTVVHNPELRQLLPPSFDDTVDSVLDNAYQYGREGISKLVRGMMSDVDSEKSAKLEKQVLELWDRLYQTWMSSDNAHGPKVTSAAVQKSWDSFIDDIQKSPEMFNIQGITEFIKQNIGTFMSLLESVWGILKGNVTLVASSFSAFMSILLGGGTAVLNFILNIVFLTTLFYLLSSSGDLYKPVELMTNISPSGSRFGLALEGAVNGVFKATFKMAAFYGMWTWFIHNWFSVQIVYLPSALAAILGAVPFLGTYWACIPAVLDLWLAQGKSFQAILFAVFQFLPTSIVDTTIYNEIQGGGHPYLTGLAIAGGIFCLGVEGAIIGPLLLCALYVGIDLVSSSLFKDSPSEDAINLSRLELHPA